MPRLFDHCLARPEPVSLHDFLQTATAVGSTDPVAQRARALLADPERARQARSVRTGGTGLILDDAKQAVVIAAEAVHHRVADADVLELYAQLREQPVLPAEEALFIEVQKLRTLGPLTSYGWLVVRRPTEQGHELQAWLSTEWGGKLLSGIASLWIDLHADGRYVCEPDTPGPATRIAFADAPDRPGLLPSVFDPLVTAVLPSTVATLLASLAVVRTAELPAIHLDQAQSARYRRRTGCPLTPYRKIPAQDPVLNALVPAVREES
ncbi:hypothetical protein OG883_46245 [Streptomyces sp. NBC_01142]|uniref:hypothetical protein n=1 Tax=Streptomyces sp. NBC_01142 TaxID=2975865 RepID=UPI002255DE22|nr:hypothetical protein [Streptomyces sp. NBC_01142]MCX4827042.1 hypothetical protein [Streptomyces sp. NBC_01142]